MILNEYVYIIGHPKNISFYKKIGYDIKVREKIKVKVTDLTPGSTFIINCKCDNCGQESTKQFKEYYSYTNGLVEFYYCNKCNKIKTKNTLIEKYGVDNVMKIESVKDKFKNTLIEKYGVDHYSKTDEYKIKYKLTCIEKYGVDNSFKSEEIKAQIKETNLERYGVEYPSQSITIKEKTKQSSIKRYGVDHYSKTDDFKNQIINSSICKYGVENVMQLDVVKEKTKKSSIKRYGVDHYSKTDEHKIGVKLIRENNTYKKYISLLDSDYKMLSYKNEEFLILHNDCKIEFTITKSLLYARNKLNNCICTNCNPIGVQYSFFESEIRKFLDEKGIQYLTKDKTILNGKELDIYIPSHNIAIEANGIYWHSELYKDSKYHLNKTLKCIENNIQLLHIWEDDWINKKEILKSIILNKLKLTDGKIYSRKCVIKNVDSKTAKNFLNSNHIQGFSSSSIRIGLFYEDELVSLMTFGFRYTNSKKEFELIRFCNKINYNIIGASSKLFNHFIKNNNINEIISYSDISMFNGNMYGLLNFKRGKLSKPNYFWVVDGVKRHRFNFNKKKLVEKGNDPNKTELEIMHDLGYYRIFSCGQEKWIWNK